MPFLSFLVLLPSSHSKERQVWHWPGILVSFLSSSSRSLCLHLAPNLQFSSDFPAPGSDCISAYSFPIATIVLQASRKVSWKAPCRHSLSIAFTNPSGHFVVFTVCNAGKIQLESQLLMCLLKTVYLEEDREWECERGIERYFSYCFIPQMSEQLRMSRGQKHATQVSHVSVRNAVMSYLSDCISRKLESGSGAETKTQVVRFGIQGSELLG